MTHAELVSRRRHLAIGLVALSALLFVAGLVLLLKVDVECGKKAALGLAAGAA